MSTPSKPVAAQKSSMSLMVMLPSVSSALNENALRLVFNPLSGTENFLADAAINIPVGANADAPMIDNKNFLRWR